MSPRQPPNVPEDAPDWYRDAVVYELHVRAFSDSSEDGIGDFKGLISKLDYLHDLGVTAIWLLPFYPSPLRDDGYDIADYRSVNPSYGTMRDVGAFIRKAHERGLRVITELVLNHTSDQHPWFQRARRSPAGSRWRNFYVWSDTPDRYRDARIIFSDFESSNWSWDPVAGAYYWHRFYSHQPDLNFESADVRRALFSQVDHWFRLGVDGLRLDAVPYLYEREGTICENLPETHGFLKDLRRHVDEQFPNRMLLAEANQWPEDAAEYFGDGDECHMAYHFPLMPRLFMGLRMGERFPITEILEQTPAIPETAQWALFLRNHDELTLEMVSDEERDYMNRVYARDTQARINLGIRRRLAPLLSYNRRRMELMNALLLSMKGTPVIYYGDEIGMGDNIYLGDRNGVRTPMQWNADRNAGFSAANPQRLYLPAIIDPEAHYEAVNVAVQQGNPTSFLWWMKRLIALRKQHPAFGRGSFDFVETSNRKVLAFLRRSEDEVVMVVANLSRFVEPVELDLSGCLGAIPVEMFGGTRFPAIGDQPYFLTVGPHSFLWLAIEPVAPVELARIPEPSAPLLKVTTSDWTDVLEGASRRRTESLLANYILSRRWFAGKGRRTRSVTICSTVPVQRRRHSPRVVFTFLQVDYTEGESETYVVPLAMVAGLDAEAVVRDASWAVVAALDGEGVPAGALLVDAIASLRHCETLLDAFHRRGNFSEDGSSITFTTRQPFDSGEARAHPMRGEQSNTSVIYGHEFVLKLIRRMEPGIHPQVEIEEFLDGTTFREHVPSLAGDIRFTTEKDGESTIGVLERFVPNECEAWTLFGDELKRSLEELAADPANPPPMPVGSWLELTTQDPPVVLDDWADNELELARLLGGRIGELHLALSGDSRNAAFKPEPYTPFSQRALGQGLRARARDTLRQLRQRQSAVPESQQESVAAVLAQEATILDRFTAIGSKRLGGLQIRTHGDLHLGQVLFTGKDFVVIDFEGEPVRSLGDRRLKRSPLRDIAGMIRSFHYASRFVLRSTAASSPSSQAELLAWSDTWYRWTSASFLRGYLTVARSSGILPSDDLEFTRLLDAFLLEKALYEVRYEMDSRPDWIGVPLDGVLECLARSD